jgi:hypothetical protein
MPEPDRIGSAFDDLRTATVPRISPPGVDAAHRTVRRRRARRTAVACAAVGMIALGGLGALLRPWAGPTTPVGESPTPSPSASASLTPSAPPSSASASPTSRAQNPGPGGQTACARDGVGVSTTTGDGGFRMDFSPVGYSAKAPCAGVQVKVWLVYYRSNPDGTKSLINTEVSHLTAAKRSVVLRPAGGPCVTWLIGSGTGPIPDQLPAGVDWLNQPGPDGPFWDADHNQAGVREASLDSSCPTGAPSPSEPEPEPEPTPTP